MEILRFFGFNSACFKENDYSKFENDETDTKFLLDYNNHLKSLNNFSQYNQIMIKFEKLISDYESSVKFDNSILKKSILSSEDKKAENIKKVKKRSVHNGNITVIDEENELKLNEINKPNFKKLNSGENFFLKPDEIVTGNIKALKKKKVLIKQMSMDCPDCSIMNKTPPPKKKHRASKSIDQEETQFVDAETTIQKSVVKTKKKRKSGTKKEKKKKIKGSKSVDSKEILIKINDSTVFQPTEENLKQSSIKFIESGSKIPFDVKSTKKNVKIISLKKNDLNKTALNETKKKIRLSISTVDRKPSKGKIDQLKNLFEKVTKKTKEKIKQELKGEKKIPRVSDPKSLEKRKKRVSEIKGKSKRKSVNGIKTFVNEALVNKENTEKLNKIKESLVQKESNMNKTRINLIQNKTQLDTLASKCVSLKKMNTSCVPSIAKKPSEKPIKDFIKLNKLKTATVNKKDSMNKTINLTNKSLFYSSKHDTSQVYKALNDFAIGQLKNQKFTTQDKTKNIAKNIEVKNNALDNMVTKKPMLSRHGSTSTISTYSSLDSNTSITSNASEISEQTFKSAHSKLSGLNCTISSMMTNDKTYKSIHTFNRSKLNGTMHTNSSILKGNTNKPNLVKPNLVVNSAKTPLKKSNLNALQSTKQYLAIPTQKSAIVKTSNNLEIKKPVDFSKTPTIKITKPDSHVDYDINDLHTDDETDDDEEPNKPIPKWADFKLITERVCIQNRSMINFTKLFKASAEDNIDLTGIFRIQRNRFNARTSSAHWNCPPVWQSEGIKGDESFKDQ